MNRPRLHLWVLVVAGLTCAFGQSVPATHDLPPPVQLSREQDHQRLMDLGVFEGQSDIGDVTPPGTGGYDPGAQAYTLTSAGANTWKIFAVNDGLIRTLAAFQGDRGSFSMYGWGDAKHLAFVSYQFLPTEEGAPR
jgi:hypothetical protein